MAKIVIDLDGVLCEIKKKEQSYADVKVLPGTIEKLRALKEAGHYIILNTARHMVSTGGNVGQINKKVGKITLEWLDKNGIEYDELFFGKPHGDVYIDDNALHFSEWDAIDVDTFDTDRINIVIPMAGLGSRFVNAGYREPKPLIKCHDHYLYEWAIKSFDMFAQSHYHCRYIFVILEEHDRDWGLGALLKYSYPQSIIVKLESVTGGQAQSVLAARDYINNLNRLIIFNVDTYTNTPQLLTAMSGQNVDGIVPCFKSRDPRYSFVKTDEYDNVVYAVEKQTISDNASCGMYYFKKGRDFVWAAEKMIAEQSKCNGEYYVMPLYKKLIDNGKIIKMIQCENNWIFGTPEELNSFDKVSQDFKWR